MKMSKIIFSLFTCLYSLGANANEGVKILDCTTVDGQYHVSVIDDDPNDHVDGENLRFGISFKKSGSPESLFGGIDVLLYNTQDEIYGISWSNSRGDCVSIKRNTDVEGLSSITAKITSESKSINMYAKCSIFYKKVKYGNLWHEAQR